MFGTMSGVTRILVVGGGPGGYEAALVAAGLVFSLACLVLEGLSPTEVFGWSRVALGDTTDRGVPAPNWLIAQRPPRYAGFSRRRRQKPSVDRRRL